MRIRNEKGFALLMVMSFVAVASMGATAIVRLGESQTMRAQNYFRATESFYSAEAAAELAIAQLDNNYDILPVPGSNQNVVLGNSEYRYTVQVIDATRKRITGLSASPSFANPLTTRTIEVVVNKPTALPANFWDNVIYVGDDVKAQGNDFQVAGDVIYTDDFDTDNIANFTGGSITQDPSAGPLAQLDFQAMADIAKSQIRADGNDNFYTAAELASGVPMPTNFYFTSPDPTDPADLGVPNIVFVEGDLSMKGAWGQIGGFLLVVGDILTDPNAKNTDVKLKGSGNLDGVIYTRSKFKVDGDTDGLSVNGGVIAGKKVHIKGNTSITYNLAYMDSIRNSNPPPDMTVEHWREVQ